MLWFSQLFWCHYLDLISLTVCCVIQPTKKTGKKTLDKQLFIDVTYHPTNWRNRYFSAEIFLLVPIAKLYIEWSFGIFTRFSNENCIICGKRNGIDHFSNARDTSSNVKVKNASSYIIEGYFRYIVSISFFLSKSSLPITLYSFNIRNRLVVSPISQPTRLAFLYKSHTIYWTSSHVYFFFVVVCEEDDNGMK